MKRSVLIAALLVAFTARYGAADCAKNSDACTAPAKPASPFMQAVEAAAKTPAAGKPAARSERLQDAPAPAQPPAAAPAAPAPAAAPARTLSDPAWLIFVGGMVAGLYFYLGGGVKKKRKK
jgi:uncharacterized membrane protein